jgi:hypothetical protein
MNDDCNSVDRTPQLDRRSMLRKAAVAGAVVWTVPTILADPAHAACGTPKCAPTSFTIPIINGRDACNNEAIPNVPTGNKVALFFLSLPASVTCPCGGTAQIKIGDPPANWAKLNFCGSFDTTYANAVKVNDTTFALYKDGALGNGFYVPQGSFCVSVGCTDTHGQLTWRRCTYSVCLSYSPAGSCASLSVVTVSSSNTNCVTSCTACP